jgi:hypothetical protein
VGRFFFRIKYRFIKWLWKNEHPKLTQDDWDKIVQLDWHGKDDQVSNETEQQYATFAGCDIKTFLVLEDGSLSLLPEVQACSFKYDVFSTPCVKGDLFLVIYNKSNWATLTDPKVRHMTLIANNEYGHRAQCDLMDVSFPAFEHGCAVDDIVLGERVTFSAKSIIPWHIVD